MRVADRFDAKDEKRVCMDGLQVIALIRCR